MAQMGKTKNIVLGLAALMIAGSLTSCDDGRSGAEGAAKQLASSLAALDVGSLAVDGKDAAAANEQLKAVFAALDPAKPSVESGAVTLDGDKASVPLNFTWKIGTAEWKYTSQAALKKSGDKWAVQWNSALLEPDLKDGEVLDKTVNSPSRADILGAGDAKLVSYRPVVHVGIDKTTIGSADPAASAAKLAQLVGVDEGAYVKQVQASGPQAFVSAITLREDGSRTSRSPRFPAPVASAIFCLWHQPAPSPAPSWVPRPRQAPNRSKSPGAPSRWETPSDPVACRSNMTLNSEARTGSPSKPGRKA
jgi:hypothetical protein